MRRWPQADAHFHLLPGVDDGPPDDEAALALARAAVADGTGVVVARPHVRDMVVAELLERVQCIRRLLRGQRIPLAVLCGGELNVADVAGLTTSELETIAFGAGAQARPSRTASPAEMKSSAETAARQDISGTPGDRRPGV
jgi:protein-tyrosine phosphatase